MTWPVRVSHRTPFHRQQSWPRHDERRPAGSKRLSLKERSASRSLATQPLQAAGVAFASTDGIHVVWKVERSSKSAIAVAAAPWIWKGRR